MSENIGSCHSRQIGKRGKAKGNCGKLVYFEEFNDINQAIEREKQLKTGSRKHKESLINYGNPEWLDLAEGWVFQV